MMNFLGIYFGSKLISLSEVKGKKVLNSLQVPLSNISSGFDSDEKVLEEVKIVALLNNELRKGKVESKEVAAGVSGKDLIIRTFDLPVNLPKSEIAGAVSFEARKYIPFKLEELVSDFKVKQDKSIQRNLVLFVGIKKETLDKYTYILNQLNIKPLSIEYAGFSMLRLMSLSGVKFKGTVGVVTVDLVEEDEANFVVLENSFPLFSRDISLTTEAVSFEESMGAAEESAAAQSDRLRTEIRVSLDFYLRKFPGKDIDKIYVVCPETYRAGLDTFIKDRGIELQFMDFKKTVGDAMPFSLGLFKAYSSAVIKSVKSELSVNLLEAKGREAAKRSAMPAVTVSSLLSGLRVSPMAIILILTMFILSGVFYFKEKMELDKRIETIISTRPQTTTISPDINYTELVNVRDRYKRKINTIETLTKKRIYFTEVLDLLPRLVPTGMWLTKLGFFKNEAEMSLSLKGMVYLGGDSDKELELIQKFISNLKENQFFNKHFSQVSVLSIDYSQIDKATVTNFEISCSK